MKEYLNEKSEEPKQVRKVRRERGKENSEKDELGKGTTRRKSGEQKD